MLRTVHVFDISPNVDEPSFVEWLDGMLWEHSRGFGCQQRQTWVFLDGIEGDYDSGRPGPQPPALPERGVLGPTSSAWRTFGPGCVRPMRATSASGGSRASATTPSCATWTTRRGARSATTRMETVAGSPMYRSAFQLRNLFTWSRDTRFSLAQIIAETIPPCARLGSAHEQSRNHGSATVPLEGAAQPIPVHYRAVHTSGSTESGRSDSAAAQPPDPLVEPVAPRSEGSPTARERPGLLVGRSSLAGRPSPARFRAKTNPSRPSPSVTA